MIEERKPPPYLGLGVLVFLSLAIALLVAFNPGRPERPGESTLQRIQRTGMVRIGYANEAPYGYLDTATAEVTGEAPEIARVILARMGIDHVDPVVTEFGSLIPGLKAKRFDIIAAGMYITPQRCREAAFSNPTYKIGEAFIVRKGNPLDLHSFEDVARHATATLGFVGGTVEQGYAEAVGIPEDRIVLFPDNISSLTAVRAGRIDAAAATSLTVRHLLRKADTDEVEIAEPFYDPVIEGETTYGYGAFGFRQEDRELVVAFNRHLEDFIGSKEHLELTAPFGISRDSLPGDVTSRALCADE